MQQRRGTANQWISTNQGNGPILSPGEIGFESDTNKFKIGDGVNHWVDLTYFTDAESITTALNSIIDGAPAALNTLNELAQALGDDANFLANLATESYVDTAISGITNPTISIQQVATDGTATETYSNITTLQFDEDSGFDVTNPTTGTAKVAMNSTFKYWEVDGTQELTATGLDTVNFISGAGIDISADGSSDPQSLTIAADFSGLATETYVDTAVGNVTVDLSTAAGEGLDWNAGTLQFDVDSEELLSSPTISESLTFDGTGDFTISADETIVLDATTINISAGTGDFTVSADENIILDATTEVYIGSAASGNEVATKAYVDAVAQGLDVKDSVKVATSTSLTEGGGPTGGTGPGGGGTNPWATTPGVEDPTIDGVTLSIGDRVLVKDNYDGFNGIHEVVSNVAGYYMLERTADGIIDDTLTKGAFVFVEGGTSAGKGFVANIYPAQPPFMEYASVYWSQFSEAGNFISYVDSSHFIASGGGLSLNNPSAQSGLNLVYGDTFTVNFGVVAENIGTGNGITTEQVNNVSAISIDTDVVATLQGTQTITNKTITSPTVNNPNIVLSGTHYTEVFSGTSQGFIVSGDYLTGSTVKLIGSYWSTLSTSSLVGKSLKISGGDLYPYYGYGDRTLIAGVGTQDSQGLELIMEVGTFPYGIAYNTTNVFNVSISTVDVLDSELSATELSYLDGVTSSIQTQIDSKASATSISDATINTAARGPGYMGIPQSSADTTGSYTVVAADAGEHIYTTATRTITIDSNANLALPIGTTLTFIAAAGATATIAITSDTLLLAGPGTSGSRTLAPHGMATAVKVAATTWYISGNGLT